MDCVDWDDGSSAFLGLGLADLSVLAFFALGLSTWSSGALAFAASSSARGVASLVVVVSMVSDMSGVLTFVLDCLPVGRGYAPVGRVTFFLVCTEARGGY